MLDNPFSEEIFPNIQFKLPLMQPEAIVTSVPLQSEGEARSPDCPVSALALVASSGASQPNGEVLPHVYSASRQTYTV